MGYYCENDLKKIGFKSLGENVKISDKASIYGASEIEIGNNVRIDDFCILSGNIKLGDYIHIGAYSAMFAGKEPISIASYSTLSSRCVVYSKSDDYSGEFMTNPTIPDKYLGVLEKKVEIGEHVIVGTGTTVLPGVVIEDGCSIGAMSLVNKSVPAWSICYGIPCVKRSERGKGLLVKFKEFQSEQQECGEG